MHTITVISLFALLILVSVGAMLLLEGIKLCIRISKAKAEKQQTTASVLEARPEQVVSEIPQPEDATAPSIAAAQSALAHDVNTSTNSPAASSPIKRIDWHEFDEPTCLRKPQAFVFA